MEQAGYSQRRACGLVGMKPKTFCYASRWADDMEVRQRLRALAAERRLHGEGVRLNHKRLFRFYRQERLGVRKRGGRKRALGTRSSMALLEVPNQRWSLDFVSDTFNDGRRFQALTVVNDFIRECLGPACARSNRMWRRGRVGP